MKQLGVMVAAILFLIASISFAGPTKVGNGDDGGDLENAVPVQRGILHETRKAAVEQLRAMKISSIEGLSLLIPEVQRTEILLVGRDVDLSKTDATPEMRAEALEVARSIGAVGEKDQPVYARTFAEPHAATRFFPAALRLDRAQLIALHIHEALHRALPASIREDEKAVSRITLALIGTDTSYDRVKTTVGREIARAEKVAADERTEAAQAAAEAASRASLEAANPEPRNLARMNNVEYEYRSYFRPDEEMRANIPVSSLHSLKSFMYPFGENQVLGLGLEFTFVGLSERSYLGPVGLSSRLRIAKWDRFDVDLFAALHMNTVSAGEIKNVPVGRDTGTFGIAIRREDENVRIENQIYVTPGSEANQTVAGITYNHKYGASLAARVSALGKWAIAADRAIEFGGTGEVLLGSMYEVTGGPTATYMDRLRVVSAGPEIGYRVGDMRVAVNGRFVIDSTKDASLEQLGDLLGQGVGQGSVGGSVSWRF